MGTTRKGEATRQRILDAAWQLSDARGIEALLNGVTLRQIADEVDMAPSAVTYHFPTMRDLALGMVDRLQETLSLAPVEAVEPLLGDLTGSSMSEVIRDATRVNWAVLTEPSEIRVQRMLNRCYAMTGEHPDGARVRRQLAEMSASWVAQIAQMYHLVAERMGVHLIEPFTYEELARAASGMHDGLLNAWMCDPAVVRDDLGSDLLVALVSATAVPTLQRTTLEEVATRLPRAESELAGDEDVVAAAELVGPLFAGGIEDVTLTEVAERLSTSPDEVVERYGSIESVAALSFRRHQPRVAAAAERRRTVSPRIAAADGVYELVRCAQEDRHCALALAHARHRSALGSVDVATDPRGAVPVDEVLAEPLTEVLDADERTARELAGVVVDTVLTQAAIRSRAPVSQLTELALRLVPGY